MPNAEQLSRKWIAVEKNRQYAEDSELRFTYPPDENNEADKELLLFEM